MRQIKFRGLNENGGWVYGSYVTDKKSYHAIAQESPADRRQMINIPALVESVGQLTGLQDNSGVDIYEGDILEELRLLSTGKSYKIALVEYKAPSFEVDGLALNNYMGITWKVVGNIHQNPGLLK